MKRDFREVRAAGPGRSPSYPTLEEFDRSSRRSFLARVGAALVGAGGLAVLGACGERRATQGKPALPDARVDATGDGEPVEPDQEHLSGGAPAPDARVDRPAPAEPDARLLAGDVPGPDARGDEEPPVPTMGKRQPPDARIDQGSCGRP